MMVFYVSGHALYSSHVPRLHACILQFVCHTQFLFFDKYVILVMYINISIFIQ